MMAHSKRYILLADDDGDDQDLLTESILLHRPSALIKTVNNGPQVLAWLDECPDGQLPVILILDYKMPMLNAAQVLDELNSNARYADLPKVVWSTSSNRQHVDECLSRGALGYFPKPNDVTELAAITVSILSLCETVEFLAG
ncbi:MAG TPA: response regulator [Puia sp.]|jgi:CheY-like chemotaxis protein|nr:response regulator [Puia sp.]